MIRKIFDLLIIIAITLMAVFIVLSGMQNFVRVLFAMALVFGLPGYTIVAAMFSHHPFRMETHIVFAIALSVSLAAISGFLLHFSPWGLQTTSWLIMLASITLFASVIAIIRRSFSPSFTSVYFKFHLNGFQVALSGLTVVLTVAAIFVARNGVLNQPHSTFTQLWMLPLAATGSNTIQVGIRNAEANPTIYSLVVIDGNTILRQWDGIELQPGETWEDEVTAGQFGDRVDARLYRDDAPEMVYRSVSLALGSDLSPSP